MAETLSQSEISALLSALSPSGEESDEQSAAGATGADAAGAGAVPTRASEAKIKVNDPFLPSDSSDDGDNRSGKRYDFKKQTKFSKEQLGTIELIHESFARLVATDLTTMLRVYAQASIVSVEQRTFEELIHSIYDPTFIIIFRFENLDGKAFLDINLNVVFSMLDRLLGGTGAPLGVLRQLTEVEKQIMQKILFTIIDRLRESWINIIDLAPTVELVESNPQFAQIAPPGEIVLSITVEIKIHDVSGIMTLCVPYTTVEPVAHKFNAASWFAAVRKEPTQTNIETISGQIKNVYLKLVAEIGTATVSVKDVLALQKGDIILTDQKVAKDLNVRVGNMSKFKARPGILGKKMAICLTEIFDPPIVMKEEEDN